MATKILCNICGKELNEFDYQENIGYHDRIGYGSKYDTCDVDLDICCSCFDKILDWIKDNGKINPIKDE